MADGELSCAFLRECAARYDEGERRFDTLIESLDEEAANVSPGPKRWSIAQCIDHLNVTAILYEDATRAAIRKGRDEGKTGTAPYGKGTFVGRFIISALDKGRKKKLGAPGMFRPSSERISFAECCADYRRLLNEQRAWLREADGLALGKIRVATPISKLVRMSLAQVFELHSKHVVRHIEQAEEVRGASGFGA